MPIVEEKIGDMIVGGLFDDYVVKRAKMLLVSGDMEYDFLCDDCDRGDCNDCQKEKTYNEGHE